MEADLIIRGADVYDGTGSPPQRTDIAVTGDRIAAVGDLSGSTTKKEVDGSGLSLSPGFVDMHGHSDFFLMILPSAEGKIKQGVTTEVGGNCGYSAAPLRGDVKEDRVESHKELYELDVTWDDFHGFLEAMEKAKPAINYAGQVGFNTVRASAGCQGKTHPTSEEMAAMKDMVRESMEAGALGMSMGLIYPPAAFAETDEIIEVAKVVAEYDGMASSHIRSEGDVLVEAIQESADIAMCAGVRFQVSHLKTSGPKNWGKLNRVFEIIESAHEEGYRMAADRYPYLASFTQLSASLPEWVYEDGKEAFLKRIADPDVRQRIREEVGGPDLYGDRWDRIVVSQVMKDGLHEYEAKPVKECAEMRGMDPVDFVCWLVGEARDRVSATFHTMSTGNLGRIYQKDWVMVGSDAAVRTHSGFLSEGKPHPRAYGTMPRMISWVVREKKWIDLSTAIKKMTHDPCEMAGIKDRGIIREGAFADLVLFNPNEVKDTATYEHPQQYPEGITMVVVNGKVAVEGGELTGERAGQVLRRDGA